MKPGDRWASCAQKQMVKRRLATSTRLLMAAMLAPGCISMTCGTSSNTTLSSTFTCQRTLRALGQRLFPLAIVLGVIGSSRAATNRDPIPKNGRAHRTRTCRTTARRTQTHRTRARGTGTHWTKARRTRTLRTMIRKTRTQEPHQPPLSHQDPCEPRGSLHSETHGSLQNELTSLASLASTAANESLSLNEPTEEQSLSLTRVVEGLALDEQDMQ